MSLSPNASVTFSYREELTHHESHTPLFLSALNPATYAGAALGQYDVTAVASLTIFDGDRSLGDYSADSHVSQSYSIYSEPTHSALDDAARAAVREMIDQKLERDYDRLAKEYVGRANPPAAPAEQ